MQLPQPYQHDIAAAFDAAQLALAPHTQRRAAAPGRCRCTTTPPVPRRPARPTLLLAAMAATASVAGMLRAASADEAPDGVPLWRSEAFAEDLEPPCRSA